MMNHHHHQHHHARARLRRRRHGQAHPRRGLLHEGVAPEHQQDGARCSTHRAQWCPRPAASRHAPHVLVPRAECCTRTPPLPHARARAPPTPQVDGARGLLNEFLADVYIFTDASAGGRLAGLGQGEHAGVLGWPSCEGPPAPQRSARTCPTAAGCSCISAPGSGLAASRLLVHGLIHMLGPHLCTHLCVCARAQAPAAATRPALA